LLFHIISNDFSLSSTRPLMDFFLKFEVSRPPDEKIRGATVRYAENIFFPLLRLQETGAKIHINLSKATNKTLFFRFL